MSESQNPVQYPPNPDFGNGVFRRRIRLQGQPGRVIAELEDCCHGFRCVVSHDGHVVTDVQAESLRVPLNSCSGATQPIKAMIGMPLNASALSINREINPKANCTHLYDLTVLAIGHCLRGDTIRQYDISVEDEVDQPTTSKVLRDGIEILNWQTRQWTIMEPAKLAGKPLYKGFALWANEAFSDDEQEAAFALQKGYFVAQARIYDLDKMAGTPATAHPSMAGVCYSYSPEVVATAFRTENSNRDFTDTAEQLLKFL